MGKQTFDREKKTLCILLVVFFIVSLTTASVSAAIGSGATGCGGKATSSVAGKSSATARDPVSDMNLRNNFHGDFDRDFDRNFNNHFGHLESF
jgi:hypothetical protein